MNPVVAADVDQPVAVIIPCFKVRKHILSVIESIGSQVAKIYVVDDCCPDESGEFVRENCKDSRVIVLRNARNLGVGGAVITGYRAALGDGMAIMVKIDGDGQMDPALLPRFIRPIQLGQADYTKGNRFYDLEEIKSMPTVRLIGNAALSFMAKLSTGYWNLFDPTNGYTAIHCSAAMLLPLDKLSQRYFFETDVLFRLNSIKAVTVDVPMSARYADEVSNLKISQVLFEFSAKHTRNFFKRIFYNYYLRDMSLASIELPIGIFLLAFGTVFGLSTWIQSANSGITTPSGTVMLSAMPIIIGVQLILAFLAYDISALPTRPLQNRKEYRDV